VNARQTKYRAHCVFFCDCPVRHRMKLVKPSGLLGKRAFCDYFAHIAKRSKQGGGATPVVPQCAGGGESLLHRMAKQRLREMVGMYSFAVFRCTECGKEERVDTRGCKVNIEVRSHDGRWRYDCLLSRGAVKIAALEVVHTHRSSDDKVAAVRASGLEIAEFRVGDVMELDCNSDRTAGIDNLHLRWGRCQVCLVRHALKWQRDCFVDELVEMMRQEEEVGLHYERASELNRVLAMEPLLKKCQHLLVLGLKTRVKLYIPRIGEIRCSEIQLWQHGVLVSGFNQPLATKQICIFLVQKDSDAHTLQWQHGSVMRDFHVFINCSTVLKRLGSLADEHVLFKDCRWAILKELERSRGLCANCGRMGHTSDACYTKFCIRCGRAGHLRVDCFARVDVLGNNCS
jgi:hypothetical protein